MTTSTDPRVARTRQKLLEAARLLLHERGPAGITHQNVAERAGIGRATVYRHWARPDDLLIDAIRGADRALLGPLDGTLRDWLRRELRRLAAELSTPGAASALLAVAEYAGRDPDFADVRDAVQARTVAQLDDALRQATGDGMFDRRPPATVLAAQLVGPLLFRTIFQALPVDDEFIDAVVDGALAHWSPSAADR